MCETLHQISVASFQIQILLLMYKRSYRRFIMKFNHNSLCKFMNILRLLKFCFPFHTLLQGKYGGKNPIITILRLINVFMIYMRKKSFFRSFCLYLYSCQANMKAWWKWKKFRIKFILKLEILKSLSQYIQWLYVYWELNVLTVY